MEKARPDRGELAPGEMVAGRYRIVAPLGAGAMGEVYEAEDLELGAPVAIKLLLPAASDAGEVAARFRREVLLARRVTHPNVCRIFDLGVHRAGDDGAGQGRLFLSMELVRGETLAARLRERGALDPDEALPIVRQLAAALDAAHAAGVVHRDLKCANVLLEEGADGTRAVVTDFGLARALEGVAAPPDAPTLTVAGGVLGTPAYMSPEQVEGQPAGPSSDLYSLGVILFEMVTGALPFPGASPLSAAVRRLREEPPRPSLLRPGLDPLWERTILRCLARDPAERFRSAGEVASALSGRAVAPSGPQRTRRHRRLVAGAATALLALLALAGVWWTVRWTGAGRGAGAGAGTGARSGVREAVAVLGFRNLTGRPEAAWLSSALAEMLTTEAAAGGHLRAVSGESVARVRLDLGLGEPDALAPETLTRVREQLGADVVVLGGYSALGPEAGHRLRLDLRLQPTRGGEAVLFDVEGTEIELFDLVGRAGARLRQQLGVEPLSSAQDGARRAALPRSAEAARLYAEGLSALRRREAATARELLARAAEAEPGFAPARAALAMALTELGYQTAALTEAERAAEGAAGLPREEALRIEGVRHEVAEQWPAAAETYRALAALVPDDLDTGLLLARTLRRAGEAAASLETVAALRRLPPPAGYDPRLDLAAAEGYAELGRHAERLEAALAAGRRARELGAGVLLAWARFEEGAARRRVGERDLARGALEEARRLLLQAGDRVGAADVLIQLAGLLRQEGDLSGAATLFGEALSTYDTAGNRRRAARARFSLALLLADAGRVEEAERGYEEALAVFREAGDRQGAVAALANIGTMRYLRGDLAGAIARHEEALAVARELGNRSRAVTSLLNLAAAHLDAGDPVAARSEAEEAVSLAAGAGDRQAEGRGRWVLCTVETAAAAYEAARGECERALVLLEAEQEVASVAGVEIDLARLALARGATGEAVARARSAAARLAGGEFAGDAALAGATLAEALLAAGERTEAERALSDARRRLAGSDELRPRQALDRAAARRAAAAGDRAGARALWQRLGREARALGMLGVALESEVEASALGGAAGRAELPPLAAAARERGLLALAARADELGRTAR